MIKLIILDERGDCVGMRDIKEEDVPKNLKEFCRIIFDKYLDDSVVGVDISGCYGYLECKEEEILSELLGTEEFKLLKDFRLFIEKGDGRDIWFDFYFVEIGGKCE